MHGIDNERGSVLVFATLLIVLLMIMVGMGLDTGQLTYVRSQGQTAVDAAALTAASGLPIGAGQVTGRVGEFNSTNNYVESPTNPIDGTNITYVQYDDGSGAIIDLPDINDANGVRVALEQKNPYTGDASGTGITTPVFLTPLLNLFGSANVPAKRDISVSAVAVLKAVPGIPIAIMSELCNGTTVVSKVKLRQSNAKTDNSCWTTYTENPPSAKRVQELFTNSRTCSNIPASSDLVTIGTLIELNNGQQAADYEEAYSLFMDQHPNRCWMVPVIPNSTKCNQSDPILDWARICPTDVVKQTKGPEPMYIEVNLACGQSLFKTKDNLCFSPRLVRDTKSGM